MAKDRNTMAKRQREVEKREKAVRKREKREKRQSDALLTPNSSTADEGQVRVLSIFRRYLMSTGQMLCLSGTEFESNKERLVKLVEEGLLVAETFPGGYSLTSSGFEAMRRLASKPG